MEPNGQEASFIPKEGVGRTKIRMKGQGSTGKLSLITGLFAFFVVALFVALSIYQGVLLKDNTRLQDDIAKIQLAFDRDLLKEVQTVDRKLQAAEDILAKHAGFGSFLRTLEAATVQDVQYEGASFEVADADELELRVVMAGEATDFQILEEQSKLFTEEPLFLDHTFAGFNRNDAGRIAFELTIELDPEQFVFAENFKQYAR